MGPWLSTREQTVTSQRSYLEGWGARYSILARISSGILESRLVSVLTITHVLHALTPTSATTHMTHAKCYWWTVRCKIQAKQLADLIRWKQQPHMCSIFMCPKRARTFAAASGDFQVSPGGATNLLPSALIFDDPVAASRDSALFLKPRLNLHQVPPALTNNIFANCPR